MCTVVGGKYVVKGSLDFEHPWYGAHLFPQGVYSADFFAWISNKASEGDADAQYDIYVAYYNGIPGVIQVNHKIR